MFISVVIPLFNKRKYIQRAVESVLCQTHQEFELIVVDDGSTDGCAEVVSAIDDSRIRLISQPNQGVSVARNAGVVAAKAEWVAFLDADDEYYPEFLATIISFLEGNQGIRVTMLGTNCYRGDPACTPPDTHFNTGIYDNYFELYQNRRCPNNSSSTVANKKFLLEVGGFPVGRKQLEDWTTWFKLAFHGSFGYVGTPLAICHRVEGSASTVKREPAAFVEDMVALLNTLSEGADKLPEESEKRRSALGCRNELVMQFARILAFEGEKGRSLRLLTRFRFQYFNKSQVMNWEKLFVYLMMPYFVIETYRHAKRWVVVHSK